MAHGRTVALVLTCLIPLSAGTKLNPRTGPRTVDAKVARLVEPVLDALVQSQGCSDREESFYEADKHLGTILGLRTDASDEALVVLLYFYIGESSCEDIIHEISKRGRRMVPYLRRYRDTAPDFANRRYPPCLLVESSTRVEFFDEVIRAIGERKIIGED